MSGRHPYQGLPGERFWKDAGPGFDPAAFDPVGPPPFAVTRDDRVVTAGSCFAQHVARALASAGFRHHVTEWPHPLVPADVARAFGYGLFSARYGNVYTARQFLQLARRAFGEFEPCIEPWPGPDGGWVDPFRPRVTPGGYETPDEMLRDRRQHLQAVRHAFEEADVLVFTLGLTEAWEDRCTGAVLPLAPGVAGGVWDPDGPVGFRNFDEGETRDDLIAALRLLRARNPGLRIVLTVSPVPLAATFAPRHVAVSTAWSKAVLRVAAEAASAALPDCWYFPSYEIVTSPLAGGRLFGSDAREVTPEGVATVMRLFLRHAAGDGVGVAAVVPALAPVPAPDAHGTAVEAAFRAICDEEAITGR